MSSRSGKGPSSSRGLTVHVRKANKRSVQSRAWLERQLNDPYVAAAQAQGYRSRAAFKLIEMDDRYSLIKPGCLVVDLGAAPGGWAQVAVKRGAAKVLGLDLLPINPVQGATFLEGDFNDEDMPARLTALMGAKVDVVLSDMAPNTTGHRQTDHLRIVGLIEAAAEFEEMTVEQFLEAPNVQFLRALWRASEVLMTFAPAWRETGITMAAGGTVIPRCQKWRSWRSSWSDSTTWATSRT